MTDIVERLRSIDDNSGDVTWYFIVREAADEIKRLRAENERLWADVEHLQAPTNVEIMLSDAKTEIKRLREALLAAKDYIGNGYQPPELIKQIDSALKQSG